MKTKKVFTLILSFMMIVSWTLGSSNLALADTTLVSKNSVKAPIVTEITQNSVMLSGIFSCNMPGVVDKVYFNLTSETGSHDVGFETGFKTVLGMNNLTKTITGLVNDTTYSVYFGVLSEGKSYLSDPVEFTTAIQKIPLDTVVVNGIPSVGNELSVVLSPNDFTADFQWRSNGILVGTGDKYTIRQEDVGKLLVLHVSGTGECAGINRAVSIYISPEGTKSLNSISVSGAAIVGRSLSAYTDPVEATVDYTWYVNGIETVTGSSLMITSDMVGKFVKVKAIGIGQFSGVVESSNIIVDGYTIFDSSLDGSVMDVSGGICVGYTLELLAYNGSVAASVTDSDGKFNFQNLVSGDYTVNIKNRQGTYMYTTNLRINGQSHFNFTVDVGTLTGAITLESTGEVVFPEYVKLTGNGKTYLALLTTPGNYRIVGAKPGEYVIVVKYNSENYDCGRVVVSDNTTLDLQIKDVSGITMNSITGTLSSSSGAPLSNYLIRASVDGYENTGFASTTIANGFFSVSLQDGSYVFTVIDPNGNTVLVTEPSEVITTNKIINIVIPDNENPPEKLVRLTGKVVDSSGNPFTGASVGVTVGKNTNKRYSIGTDSEGNYVIENVPEGVCSFIVFGKDGNPYYNPAPVSNVTNHNFNFTVPADRELTGYSFTGIITLESTGNPIPGMTVSVDTEDGVKSSTTDEYGYYSIENLPKGSYLCTISYNGKYKGTSVMQLNGCMIINTVYIKDPTLPVEETEYFDVSGKVFNRLVGGIAGASILFSGNDVEYDPITVNDGTYFITNIAKGTYDVVVKYKDVVIFESEIVIDKNNDELNFEANIGSKIKGIVLKKDGSTKLSEGNVKMVSSDGSVYRSSINNDGVYEIKDIPYGEYTVSVEWNGQTFVFEEVEFSEYFQNYDINLNLAENNNSGGNSGGNNSGGNSGNNNSGGSSGGTQSPSSPPIVNGSKDSVVSTDKSVTATLNSTRTKTKDGEKTHDSVIVDSSKVKELLSNTVSSTEKVKLVVTNSEEKSADEVSISLDPSSVSMLANGSKSLEVELNSVTISVPNSSLGSIVGSDKLSFTVSTITDVAAVDKVKESVQGSKLVVSSAGNSEIKFLGTPLVVETNQAKLEATLTIPLTGVELPSNIEDRKSFLNSLSVYVDHTDGTKELLKGNVVYDKDGRATGISVDINKFSTFTLLSYTNLPPVASKLKISGNATIGSVIKVSYTYKDNENDTKTAAKVQWFRSTSSTGKGKVAIKGATKASYKVTSKDSGKYLICSVTPKAKAGTVTGKAVYTRVKIDK